MTKLKEKLTEKLSEAGNGAPSIVESAETVTSTDSATAAIADVGETIKKKAGELTELLQQWTTAGAEIATSGGKRIANYIQNNPLIAVIAATGVAAFVWKLRGRNRERAETIRKGS